MKSDRTFDAHKFMAGARDAFPMIVEAFARGDTDTLQDLLAPKVYDAFLSVIEDRKTRCETVSTEIHAVRGIEFIEARLVGTMSFIGLRIEAEETCVIRDQDQHIISGNPDRITPMVDVWIFGRETRAKDPTWLLYETRDDMIEPHGTNVPTGGA
jgi:predicted lipid-binding transport protein (Tim44 family)